MGLADEIKDLLDQLGEGGRSIHALDKQRRMLEQEEEELQGALEEAEATLEMEENRVLRSQLELANVRQEIDRRVAEKEEEFNTTRKNHQRAMESMSASLESEQRAKGDALRVKKKLEGEINELEIGLDHANKANAEGLKAVKRYQLQLRETIQAFEDEARSKAQITEQVGISERKAAALSGEVEESKALLDGANRAIRQLQNDIADPRGAVNNMQTINGRDMTSKRQLESSIHTLRLKLMVCLLLPRMLRRRLRRLWLMLLVLLMNSVPSRSMFLPLELERTLFPMLLESLRDVCLMLRMLPSSLAKLPWLSLKARSVSLRLSLPPPSPALERPPRLTRELSARPRNLPLPRVRTRRTRTVCLSLPASCR